jgi:hypothetical protein
MTRGASTQLVLLYFAGWLKESAIELRIYYAMQG